MNRFCSLVPALAAIGSLSLTASPTWAGPSDPDTTARTLVEQCANLKAGDKVFVSGRPSDMTLLESICVQVRKAGAFPMLSVSSDMLSRRLFDEVPEKYDPQVNEFDMAMANIVTASISISSTENPALFAGANPARMAARAKAGAAVEQTFLRKNIQSINLGNGLFPTDATAKMYGMDKSQLADIFWAGVNIDYSALQSSGAKVKSVFESGKSVRITNPNGTDISFKIDRRPCFVSDGVISKEDMAKGGAACQVWLPAGEVYGTPTPGTANGRIVFDTIFYEGKEISHVTLEFQNGKMTSMKAKSGLEPIQALYDAAGTGKDEFAFFDVGINPAVRIPAGSKLQSWVPEGMITLGVGGNTWAGGRNECAYGFSGYLPDSTLTIDDKVFIEKGTLRH